MLKFKARKMIEKLTTTCQPHTSSASTLENENALLTSTSSETQKPKKKRKSKKQQSSEEFLDKNDAREWAIFPYVPGVLLLYKKIFLEMKHLRDCDFILLDERLDKQFGVAEQHTNLFMRALIFFLLHFCYDRTDNTFNTPRFKNMSGAIKKRVGKRADLQMAALIACVDLYAQLNYQPGKSRFKISFLAFQ
jgi:hypothetical protein